MNKSVRRPSLVQITQIAKTSTAPLPPRYEDMCRAIALAYEVDEVKDIRDKVQALGIYAKQAMNTEPERQACDIRLRAERNSGRMLQQLAKAKARADAGNPTLADLGITRKQAEQWKALAEVSAEAFENALAAPGKKSAASIVAAYRTSQGA